MKPLYGIKTGLNEAFLIDTPTRDRLVRDDPKCAEIIRPYLRGQDIERWWSPPSGLHMIVMKSSGDYPWPWADASSETAAEAQFKLEYPSLYAHMKQWEQFQDDGKARGLRYRQDKGRFWWELRPCSYYELFHKPKILYVDITWSPSFSLELSGCITNNTSYFIPSNDPWLGVSLNSPVGWWFSWRCAQHGKDEALRYFSEFVDVYPIAKPDDVHPDVESVSEFYRTLRDRGRSVNEWLRHEFGLDKPGRALAEPQRLDADGFVAAVRAALPRARKLSAADIARLKAEYAETVAPARAAAAEILTLERRLSDLVNAAYGLTPEEVALMWRTAPPRMPLDAAEELRRLGVS